MDVIAHGNHVVRIAIAHDNVGVPDVEAMVGVLAGRISESDRDIAADAVAEPAGGAGVLKRGGQTPDHQVVHLRLRHARDDQAFGDLYVAEGVGRGCEVSVSRQPLRLVRVLDGHTVIVPQAPAAQPTFTGRLVTPRTAQLTMRLGSLTASAIRG